MDLPREVPVMTLPNAILFPQAMLPLYIFEPRYRQMLTDALNSHRMFSVAIQKPGRVRETPSAIAGLGLIRASVLKKDGTSNLILQGIARVELAETVRSKPYRVARIRPLKSVTTDSVVVDALSAKVLELVAERLKQGFELPIPILKQIVELNAPDLGDALSAHALREGIKYLAELRDPEQLADLVSCTLLPGLAERQTILETIDLETRLKNLIHFLMAEIRRHRNNSQT